jgi:hypothetical protein
MPDYGQPQQGGMNWLARLKGMMSPTSPAGILGNQDAYAKHVSQAVEAGQQPMSRMQFLQMIQSNPEFAKQFMGP